MLDEEEHMDKTTKVIEEVSPEDVTNEFVARS